MLKSTILTFAALTLTAAAGLTQEPAPPAASSCTSRAALTACPSQNEVTGCYRLTQDITVSRTCFVVGSASGSLDIDGSKPGGGAYRVTVSGGDFVSSPLRGKVRLSNLSTNGRVYLLGDSASGSIIENSEIGALEVAETDDVYIYNSQVKGKFDIGLDFYGSSTNYNSPYRTLRFKAVRNTIENANNKVIALRGACLNPLLPTEHVFYGNTVISRDVSTPGDEPMMAFIWCVNSSRFENNVFKPADDLINVANVKSQGLRVRDASDNNLFLNNTVIVDANVEGDFGALNVTSGNLGNPNSHDPRGNIFRANVFRSLGDRVVRLDVGPANCYERNIFQSNSGAVGATAEGVGANFYQNTFYNGGGGAALQLDNKDTVRINNFNGNILASSGNPALDFDNFNYEGYQGAQNLFFSLNAAQSVRHGSSSYSVAAFSSASTSTPKDDIDSVFGNPAFVDPAAGNLALGSGSAAVLRDGQGNVVRILGHTGSSIVFSCTPGSDTLAPNPPQNLAVQ